eukprot:COSAG02_NODE_841_length_16613_cov_61.635703_1_plen_54_part_00
MLPVGEFNSRTSPVGIILLLSSLSIIYPSAYNSFMRSGLIDESHQVLFRSLPC